MLLYGGGGVGGVWNICGYTPPTRKGKLGISCQTRSVLAGIGELEMYRRSKAVVDILMVLRIP